MKVKIFYGCLGGEGQNGYGLKHSFNPLSAKRSYFEDGYMVIFQTGKGFGLVTGLP